MEQEAERVWVGCDGMLYVYDANSFHLLSCVTAPIAANRITRGLDGVMWIGGRTGSLEWWRWKVRTDNSEDNILIMYMMMTIKCDVRAN